MKKLVLVFVLAASVYADDKSTTGEDYRRLPENQRLAFAVGFLSGYDYALAHALRAVLLTSPTCMQQVADHEKDFGGATCFQGKDEKDGRRTYGQSMAVLDKYIADHPESWDKPVGKLAEEAFIEACEKRAKNP